MKVSVIVPYNTDRGYLANALRSCMMQDGFSLGADYEIIQQKGNFYVSRNINNAVNKAKGKYIKKCDEDDLLTPNCLRDLYEFAESGGYDFVCANSILFNNDGEEVLMSSFIPDTISQLAFGRTISISSGMILKSAMPLLDEDLWTGEDFDMILRMASSGCRFGYLDKVVYRYREHEGNKSFNYRLHHDEKTGEDRYRHDYIDEIIYRYANNHRKIRR